MKYRWSARPSGQRGARARVAPVNALWLYGGARPWRIAPPGQELIRRPGRAATRGRLPRLDALPALDAQLRARSGKQGLPDAPTELLLGDDRSVALTLKPRGSLLAGCRTQEELERRWSHPLDRTPRDALRALQASGIHRWRGWAARGVTHPDQTSWLRRAAGRPTHSAHAAGVLADAIRPAAACSSWPTTTAMAPPPARSAARCRPWARTWTSWCPTASRPATACRLPWSTAVTHRNGKPDIIITVDNGIASVDGVAAQCRRHRRGHHRPPPAGRHAARRAGHREPQPARLRLSVEEPAGVGVIFYMMLALRAELRRRGVYAADGGPRLDALSDRWR